MKVKELIKALETMPLDAEVTHLWDGEARTNIEFVWLSRGGYVVTADYSQPCYSANSRPDSAPLQKDDPYWSTPGNPADEDALD